MGDAESVLEFMGLWAVVVVIRSYIVLLPTEEEHVSAQMNRELAPRHFCGRVFRARM